MPAFGLAASAGEGRPPVRRAWIAELRATLALAAPLVLTNLAQHGLITADTVMLGRLGAPELAAATLATSLYFILFICGIGLTSAVAPLIAEALGRDRTDSDAVRRLVRAGFWAATLVAIPLMLGLWHTRALLEAIGEPPALAEDAGRYMRALQWAMWPALLFMVLRGTFAALERPSWPLAASLMALPVNIGLGVWLAFEGPGRLGMGLVGVGIATTCAAFFTLLVLVAVILRDRGLRRYRLLHRVWRFDAKRLSALFRLGLPMAGTGLAEAGLFEAAVLGMGLFGAAQLAAHAVAIQIAALCFMVPNGVAQGATVRVGLRHGAHDPQGVRLAGRVALALGFGFMTACASLQLGAPRLLIGLFLDVEAPANAAVMPYAVGFLGFAALFAVADGVQSVALGMLRGLQDTKVPMLIAVGGYWGIGVPAGAALAWGAGLQGYGIWLGFCAGLFVVAILLTARWRRLTALRDRRPGPAGPPAR
ncbi:MATE family efflux transporter [Methylobacterium sp. J-092]|uniref:MATE family efflux transporter n=1 Tax=Methylobacterium sp. J-092 TaxID=2836667 RepID=UPI001FBA0291|nr:MATE family efflux transporter [Methylobacterium sp. J-092]MCJ2008107.1 MATE family efflux transporter [Methylobacterium sp. J-092]